MSAKLTSNLSSDDDFGLLIEVTPLFSERIGPYRVVKPLDLQTYQNFDGFTSRFNVFPLIIGNGETGQESQAEAKRHILHLRESYEALPPERGTQGAKRQRLLMKQHLEILTEPEPMPQSAKTHASECKKSRFRDGVSA